MAPAATRQDTAKQHSGAYARVALFLLCLYLLSPILLQPFLGNGRGRLDVLLLFNLTTSLLWIAALHFWVRRPFILHLWLLPLYFTTAVDLFLISTFGTRFSTGYVTIILTDYGETGNFLATYTRQVLLMSLALIVILTTGLYAIRGMRKQRSSRVAAVCVALLAAAYGTAIARGLSHGMGLSQSSLDVVGHEMSAPVGAAFQTGLALYLHSIDSQLLAERSQHSFHATHTPYSGTEIYVLVIGESSRPQDWSLFGYARDTTPRLRKLPGIVPLPNMLTTAPHTSVAVPSLLSLEPITDWHAILSHNSIVSAFNEAGFTTYWLSTQGVDSWGGIVPYVAAEASNRRYYDRAFDGAMINQFRSIVESARSGAKLFIVLHTMGSHFEYSRRYPPRFAHFHTPHPDRRQRIVDEYDNSVLYTDWFLSKIISILAQRNATSALIYASDHGENLLDDDRQLLGHAIGNQYDLHTAAFIWLSDRLQAAFPDVARNARLHSGAPLSLSDLPDSILDLARIKANGLDDRLSIFSRAFSPAPRWYMVRGTLHREHAESTAAR